MKKAEKPIIVEQVFNTPKENVWKAITVLDKMKHWFFNINPARYYRSLSRHVFVHSRVVFVKL